MENIVRAIGEGLDTIFATNAKRVDLEVADWCGKDGERMDSPAQISVYWAGPVARVGVKGLR